MTLRNGLLGLGTVFTLATGVVADSPRGPLVEGREPSPVVREFHEAEPPAFGYGSGPVASEEDTGLPPVELGAVGMAWEMMLNQFTVPLGLAPMWD